MRQRRWQWTTWFSVAFVLMLVGCNAPLLSGTSERTLRASGEWHLVESIDVPRVEGVSGCGAQALAAVMSYHDDSVSATTRAQALPWQDVGATPVDLLLGARSRGFKASIMSGSWEALDASVQSSKPLLVMFDVSPQVQTLTSRVPTTTVMHWGVVNGLRQDGTAVSVAGEDQRHHVIDRDEFMARWGTSDRCAILVTRTEDVP
ncbi:MAG: hypothetical protein AAF432_00235 [Planctomycetota bacterium]